MADCKINKYIGTIDDNRSYINFPIDIILKEEVEFVMATKEIINKNGDKINVDGNIKEVSKLNSIYRDMVDKLKAFPLTRHVKNQDALKDLDSKIDQAIGRETDRLVNNNITGKDMAFFLNNLFTKQPKLGSTQDLMKSAFNVSSFDELMSEQGQQINLILSEKYKNVNSLYEDIRLVTEQLSELSEVIDTYRDAIVNPDNAITNISRVLKFDNTASNNSTSLMDIVENMEEDTGIKTKLKKNIIPDMLKYGNVYVFTQPYNDLFAKFKTLDDKFKSRFGAAYQQGKDFNSRVSESYNPTKEDIADIDALYESFKPEWEAIDISNRAKAPKGKEKSVKPCMTKESFEALVNAYVNENISVINDPLVPLMEDSEVSALSYPTVRSSVEKALSERKKHKNWKPIDNQGTPGANIFTDGIMGVNNTPSGEKTRSGNYEKEFSDVTGVFVKIYDPRRVIPVYIMDQPLGYYLLYETVQETTSNVLNAVHTLSRTTMLFQNDKKREFENRFVGVIADRICRSIDKPFLKNNKQFKELIANAIAYDNFYTKNFRVQFVTSNYITHFKINEDPNTHMGTSVLKRCMFYAMLYLTYLLFYIIMYVTRSGETRMFLIKGNGADKDLSGKMNRIIKEFKEKQISYNDFGSVRGILAKVGQGKDIGVPVGMNGDRAFDIEQLSGTQISLNDELLESLRKWMISNSGCPSAMMNYLDEVDYAKQIQLVHTQFMGRCISIQEETEVPTTDLYRKLLSFGDYGISDEDIQNFRFEWSRPKSLNTQNLGDLISVSEQLAEFLVKVFEGDNSTNDARIKDRYFAHMVKNYVMHGVFDWDSLEKELKIVGLHLREDLLEEEANKIKTDEN